MIIDIADAADDRLADYTRLTDVALRKKLEPENGLYIAESAEVIRRALDAGHSPRSLLMGRKWLDAMADVIERIDQGVPVYVGDEAELRSVTGFHVHRGAIAAMQRPALPSLAQVVEGARRIVVLEDIVDHTNVGAIFRGAAGLGVDAVLVSPSCADPLYRRSVRVSMGTVFQVPWARIERWPAGLRDLQEAGFEVLALALTSDATTLDEVEARPPSKLVWMLGTEGPGLTPHALELADRAVRIPMQGGVDSLNVAAAAAVALWATRIK